MEHFKSEYTRKPDLVVLILNSEAKYAEHVAGRFTKEARRMCDIRNVEDSKQLHRMFVQIQTDGIQSCAVVNKIHSQRKTVTLSDFHQNNEGNIDEQRGGCFNCGKTGHRKKDCPNPKGNRGKNFQKYKNISVDEAISILVDYDRQYNISRVPVDERGSSSNSSSNSNSSSSSNRNSSSGSGSSSNTGSSTSSHRSGGRGGGDDGGGGGGGGGGSSDQGPHGRRIITSKTGGQADLVIIVNGNMEREAEHYAAEFTRNARVTTVLRHTIKGPRALPRMFTRVEQDGNPYLCVVSDRRPNTPISLLTILPSSNAGTKRNNIWNKDIDINIAIDIMVENDRKNNVHRLPKKFERPMYDDKNSNKKY